MGNGAEKVLTKNGSSYVALVDAKKLDYYHALEREHAGSVLLTEAETALGQVIAGKRMSAAELDKTLPGHGHLKEIRAAAGICRLEAMVT